MAYTVNKLAKLSGVSVRTLHFYDEIGLLKPAHIGSNNYRYYEEEQLLMLQQILFFRELGLPLSEIQGIVSSSDFDKINALKSHRHILEKNLDRLQILIKTIDKTISHLRGKVTMRDVEMYDGFDPKKQQEYVEYLVDSGTITQKEIDESWDNVKSWKKGNWDQFRQEGDEVNKALVAAMNAGSKPTSAEVQDLIRRHYAWVKNFWTPTRESYIGLGQMYLNHADFRDFYQAYHPMLVMYLVEAMVIFAERELI
jgi:DNA-binding transcriptional MerR regulator